MSLQTLLNPSNDIQRIVVAVIETLIRSGFVPCDNVSGEPLYFKDSSGGISLHVVPEGFLSSNTEMYQLNFLPGPLTLKLLVVGSKLAVHAALAFDVASVNIDLNTPLADVSTRIRSGLLPYLRGSTATATTEDAFSRQPRPRVGRLPPDDPLRILPGHTPDGGDLIGPHNPIFGDPRYDPIGPGNIGEPDFDHQLPGPFGPPRQPRRPNFPFR